MGILNVTPDSFSDGGLYLAPDSAVEHALRMADEGADILDVGGESTRPGSEPVSGDEELRRVVPVVRALSEQCNVPVSIDTQKATVARAALEAGAQIVNDVSALRADAHMAAVAAESGAPVILMHMQGTPRNMQDSPVYGDVVADVKAWLAERMNAAEEAGIARNQLIVDPGFGFGKKLGHNVEILRRLHEFHELGAPLLVGTSRKSMVGALLGVGPEERLHGTLGTVACAVLSGCHILRVHDVKPALEVVEVCEAVRRGINETDE